MVDTVVAGVLVVWRSVGAADVVVTRPPSGGGFTTAEDSSGMSHPVSTTPSRIEPGTFRFTNLMPAKQK